MISESQVKAILPKAGFIRDYVAWAEPCADSHLLYHVPIALTLLSQIVPIEYFFPYGTALRANLYALIVGDSTESRKTAAIELGRDLLKEALPKKLMPQPGSPHEFVDSLIETPQQLLVYPEYGDFLSQSMPGRGVTADLRPRLTAAYDSISISRATREKRKTKENAICENPRLSFLGGVAPSFLEDHTTEGDWKGGYMARHAMFLAKRERYLKRPKRDAPGRERLVKMLLSLNASDPFAPMQIKPCRGFSSAAAQLWDDWTERFRKIDASDFARASVSRAESICLKMALLAAWDIGAARSGEPWDLDVPELEFAIKLADVHIVSVIEITKGMAIGRDMRERRRVLRMINGTATPFSAILKGAQLTARRGKELIETLLAEKTIEPTMIEGSTERGYRLAEVEPSPVSSPSVASLFDSDPFSSPAPSSSADPFAS